MSAHISLIAYCSLDSWMNRANFIKNFDEKFLIIHTVSLNLLFIFVEIGFVGYEWLFIFDNCSESSSIITEQSLISLLFLAICHLSFVVIALFIDFLVLVIVPVLRVFC